MGYVCDVSYDPAKPTYAFIRASKELWTLRQNSRYSAFGSQASSFGRPDAVVEESDYQPECTWRGCPLPQWSGTPVCWTHALVVSERLRIYSPPQGPEEPAPLPKFQSFVYYLVLSPTTVKIGTTQYLPDRMRQLRTELQYVVALELGGRLLERERHIQFADERRNKQREDFQLSERLKQHINELQPRREELMRLAIEHKPLSATG